MNQIKQHKNVTSHHEMSRIALFGHSEMLHITRSRKMTVPKDANCFKMSKLVMVI